MTGAELIAAERARQIDAEGWTPLHDAGHVHGQLAQAAACYALPADQRACERGELLPPRDWPWDDRFWKPSPQDRVRELARAGALIAAEIDRLTAAQAS